MCQTLGCLARSAGHVLPDPKVSDTHSGGRRERGPWWRRKSWAFGRQVRARALRALHVAATWPRDVERSDAKQHAVQGGASCESATAARGASGAVRRAEATTPNDRPLARQIVISHQPVAKPCKPCKPAGTRGAPGQSEPRERVSSANADLASRALARLAWPYGHGKAGKARGGPSYQLRLRKGHELREGAAALLSGATHPPSTSAQQR